LENLKDGEHINRAWENIKKNIKILGKESLGLFVSKQHKPWFDEEYVRCVSQRKQTKTQWLQNPNQSSVDNINFVKREALRHFRNKKKENLKAKINELEVISKIKIFRDLYGGISDFKKGCQPRIDIVKDEKGASVADSHSNFRLGGGNFSLSH
jgi:hypothetical protein